MAKWNEGANWTPFDDINGGQQFTNALTPEDLNKLAENIAYLYAHQGENEYLGAYAGGNYRAGAIVKYSDGNIYLCIKDTDDEQEPTDATYWEMLNESSSSGGGIETGTLTIHDGYKEAFDIVYPRFSYGAITSIHESYSGDGDGDLVIYGIPLGAPIILYRSYGQYLDQGDMSGISEVAFTQNTNCAVYKLTSVVASAWFL
jgi:hypothetical protein